MITLGHIIGFISGIIILSFMRWAFRKANKTDEQEREIKRLKREAEISELRIKNFEEMNQPKKVSDKARQKFIDENTFLSVGTQIKLESLNTEGVITSVYIMPYANNPNSFYAQYEFMYKDNDGVLCTARIPHELPPKEETKK